MEAMSNEGPHIRDYEQKSEMLWNEASKKLKHNIQYNILFKKTNIPCQKKKKRKRKQKDECNTIFIYKSKRTKVLKKFETTSSLKNKNLLNRKQSFLN